MTSLVVGDPHAKISNIREIKLLAERIVDIADQNSVSTIIILGDLSDTSDKVYLQAWNSIISFMEIISQRYEIIYIVGNHCSINNQIFLTDEHFFNAFKKWKNITIVDAPYWRDNSLFIPYTPPGRFMEALQSAPGDWRTADVIYCHQEFLGAKIGPIVSTVGDPWSVDSPLVISGHIHDKQWIGNNIYYAGTPYQTSFGDHGEKTVAVVSGKDIKEVAVTGIPKKISIKTNVSDFGSLSLSSENNYRITVVDTSENINKLKKTKSYKNITEFAKIIFIPSDAAQVTKKVTKTDGYKSILKKVVANESNLVQTLAEGVLK